MESRRYLTVIVGGLLFLLVLYSGYSFLDGTDSGEPAPDKSDTTPKQQLSRFTLNESISDTEVWSLQAPRADQSGDTIRLQSPRVVYRVQGDTRLEITADRGSYALDRRILRVWGDVQLKRIQENQILETNTLQWNRRKERIRTDSEVALRMPRGVLRARGMQTHLREETIQFLSDVRFTSESSRSSPSP